MKVFGTASILFRRNFSSKDESIVVV